MFSKLPNTSHDFMEYSWSQIEPYFQELIEFHLNSTNLEEWLNQWTGVYFLIIETQNRLRVQTSKNTTDRGAELRYQKYLDEIFPQFQIADQKLKDKLLSAGLEPDRFEIPLRKMHSEAELYREENVPLLSEELKLSKEYDKIIGAQTTTWEGKEISITQLRPVYQDRERERRQKAWQLAAERQLADREAINSLWRRFMELRAKMASNAGYDNYRDYRWTYLARFDQTVPSGHFLGRNGNSARTVCSCGCAFRLRLSFYEGSGGHHRKRHCQYACIIQLPVGSLWVTMA